MYEWKKIGMKNQKNYQKWKKNYKSSKKISSKKNFLDKSLKEAINNEKKNFYQNLEPLATRKSSEKFLNLVSSKQNLIGGSADLAGSNNTKTKKHKIIKPGKHLMETIFIME